MSTRSEPAWTARLPGVLVAAALVELVVLRTATRTLIHIPGLGRFEAPIRTVAETGRFAYYLAVVALVASLAVQGVRALGAGSSRRVVAGAGALLFLGIAAAGRLGLLSTAAVGTSSLLVLVLVAATGRRGLPMVPVGWFVLGSVAAGATVLGQQAGGGLTGGEVDALMLVAEVALVLAAVTAPLLLGARPGRTSILVGLGAAVVSLGAFTAGSSTLSILVLWNLGVPGWLPGVVYALAAGSLAATLWSALASGQGLTAAGLVLLAAGGIGTISTYQTGLVLAGLLLLGGGVTPTRLPGPARRPDLGVDQADPTGLVALQAPRRPGSMG